MQVQKRIKTIDELTLMDDYMFSQVMRETRHLKPLLEFILNVTITKIELIEPQKTEKEGYQSRGVRLDLYVMDDQGTVYNVEVQTTTKKNIPKRMRYYQSTIDVNILQPGVDYRNLRKTYVIFICNFDPFERGRCIYTFENVCREVPGLVFGDEAVKIVVNTGGNLDSVSENLKEVICYLNDGSVSGKYSQELDDAVAAIKSSEERRVEYMTMAIRDLEIREEGREEEKLSNIRRAMKKQGMSLDKALEYMDIPAEEKEKYAMMLKETSDREGWKELRGSAEKE